MSFPKCRDKLTKLGYEVRKEGDKYIVVPPGFTHPIVFSSAYTLGNWCYYHLTLDKPYESC